MRPDLSNLASQSVEMAHATRIAVILLVAVLGVIAGKIAFVSHASGAPAWSAAGRGTAGSSVPARCFEAMVELDEGYGVTGHETRLVCEKLQ